METTMSCTVLQVLRIALIGAVLSASVLHTSTIEADEGLTGGYLVDGRPMFLMYLSLTQVGETLSGYTVLVQPSVDGGIGNELSSRTYTVEGATDGVAITLIVDHQITMTGTKQGDDLVLSYATETGEVATDVFVPASPEAFNQALSEWAVEFQTRTELLWLLPAEEDVFPWLVLGYDFDITADGLLNSYPDLTPEQLTAWGWHAGVGRTFESGQDAAAPGRIISAEVVVNRFGSAESAREALRMVTDEEADSNTVNGGRVEQEGDDDVHVVATSFAPENADPYTEVTVRVRSDATIFRIWGTAPGSDVDEAQSAVLELARRVIDPVYADAARELTTGLAQAKNATEPVDSLLAQGQSDLETLQSAVAELQREFDELGQEAENLPASCDDLDDLADEMALDEVVLQHDDLVLANDDVFLAAEDFDLTARDLDARISEVEDGIAAAREALPILDASLQEMHHLLSVPLDAVFTDELGAVEELSTTADETSQELDTLRADADQAEATAADLMTRGSAILDEARATQASMSC